MADTSGPEQVEDVSGADLARADAEWGGTPATPARRGTISQVTSRPAAAQHLRDLARLCRVRDRIDREYAQPLDIEALARGAHMSAGFSRQFRLAYGESPYGYLMTRRIERAIALLRRGDLSVTEVCFAVGCSSLGTFSTRFAVVPRGRDELRRGGVARHRARAAGDRKGCGSAARWPRTRCRAWSTRCGSCRSGR